MALAGGFFSNKAHQALKQHEEYSFINIGNEQFHAVAVALIDSLQNTPRGNDAALKKILERFCQYFPKYVSNQPYLTLPERMGMLLSSSRKSELVDCMAYVLRQIEVDELLTHPLQYREVFSGLSPDTEKSYLRDPKTKLPNSALNALAQVLGISITLSFKEPGKELRMREVYVGGEQTIPAKPSLILQVQGDQYFPCVKHKVDFAYVGQLAISAPKPVEKDDIAQEETLADIVNLIAEDNKRLLQSYDQWRQTISTMVAANELNCEQLMELYISFLPLNSASSLSLSALEQSERKPVIAGFPVAQEKQTIDLLTSALASWISTKQVEPDRLFDQLESQPVSVAMR